MPTPMPISCKERSLKLNLTKTTKEHADFGKAPVAACSLDGGIEKYYLAVFCCWSPVFARAPAF